MKRILIASIILYAMMGSLVSFAQQGNRGGYGENPIEILDKVVDKANENKATQIQETALDDINDTEGGFVSKYKIANTLDYLRVNIAPYLQWAVYIGLTVAVILIVYNGFLMVTHSINKEGDFGKIKTRIGYTAIGILLLTGFYAIIKLVIGLINSVFGTDPSGSTGF